MVRCSHILLEWLLCFVMLQKWHVIENIVVFSVFVVLYFVWNSRIVLILSKYKWLCKLLSCTEIECRNTF